MYHFIMGNASQLYASDKKVLYIAHVLRCVPMADVSQVGGWKFIMSSVLVRTPKLQMLFLPIVAKCERIPPSGGRSAKACDKIQDPDLGSCGGTLSHIPVYTVDIVSIFPPMHVPDGPSQVLVYIAVGAVIFMQLELGNEKQQYAEFEAQLQAFNETVMQFKADLTPGTVIVPLQQTNAPCPLSLDPYAFSQHPNL